MWVCDSGEGGDGEYLFESVEGIKEMSDRLKVAVMLDYSCREKRAGRMSEKRCMEAKICVIAWAALCDTLFNRYAVFPTV